MSSAGPGRSRRTQSDPYPHVTPPYTIRWPAPARRTTEPTNPLVRSGSLLAQHLPSVPLQRSASRQGSLRAPQGPLIPQPALPATSVAPQPHLVTWGQGRGSPVSPLQSVSMQHQGSHHTIYQLPPANVYQLPTAPHISRQPSTQHSPHHHTHHRSRSRSRPPSAASHRYASSITPPVYGHGSSASLNASRTSLNGGVPSQRSHHASSPPPGTSISHHPGTVLGHMPSEPPQRSQSQSRVHPSSPSETTPSHWANQFEAPIPSPPSPPLAASQLFRSAQRPPLPANYDGETQTRYVSMLLALDGISPFFNILASFSTWILLAGFLLFPGTFASWQDSPVGSPQSDILDVVNHVSLYVIAWVCTGIGAAGMLWLWWRWQNNYVWLSNRIFIPGFLNSLAGVISTLSSIYGAQGGVFGKTEESTIIITSVLTVICGLLVLVYECWLLRNLRLEHDREVGVEKAGKHGEGALGEKRDGPSLEV